MSDFFTALEHELRDAAERPPRRLLDPGAAVGLAVLALVAAGLTAGALLLLGGDGHQSEGSHLPAVGTVIPKGEGHPPRESNSTVVATGTAPESGRWQLEVYRGEGLRDPKTREVYEPAGLSCVRLVLVAPVPRHTIAASGYCGPQLPGFTRGQTVGPGEILVYGRVPERAARIVVTTRRGVVVSRRPDEGPRSVPGGFYVLALKPSLRHARINWLDRTGRPGSRGIGLLPPLGR